MSRSILVRCRKIPNTSKSSSFLGNKFPNPNIFLSDSQYGGGQYSQAYANQMGQSPSSSTASTQPQPYGYYQQPSDGKCRQQTEHHWERTVLEPDKPFHISVCLVSN